MSETTRAAPARERAPAKVNLLLHVGPARADGLHELCSLFASIDLADDLVARPADADRIVCPGVEGPNLAAAALAAFRQATAAELPALEIVIEKRVPVSAGMGGGSADAAAVLRMANRLAGAPLSPAALREIGARLGADVPSQVEPRHALVTGAGEQLEPIELPPMALVLVPGAHGLVTGAVYGEADRLGLCRTALDPAAARALAAEPLAVLAGRLENDLEGAALSLRPELTETLGRLRAAGALAARITGSGPTAFGVYADRAAADVAAAQIEGATVASLAGEAPGPDAIVDPTVEFRA